MDKMDKKDLGQLAMLWLAGTLIFGVGIWFIETNQVAAAVTKAVALVIATACGGLLLAMFVAFVVGWYLDTRR